MKRRKIYSAKSKEIVKKWFILDAKDKILGRLAVQVAAILRGKNKPVFTRQLDTGDFCIVVNAREVRLSGNKKEAKTYFRHSRYPGGDRLVGLAEMLAKHPDRVIRHAVAGMLPKGKLGAKLIKKLKISAAASHPHSAQNPQMIKE